jgi:hypothetical protein
MISGFGHRNRYPMRMREENCKNGGNYDADYNNNCVPWFLYFRLVTNNVSNNFIFFASLQVVQDSSHDNIVW